MHIKQGNTPTKQHETLFQALLEGATIITPNDRLARTILDDFLNTTQCSVHQKPHCLAWSQWIQELFDACLFKNNHEDKPLLLSRHAIRHLWNNIINQQGHIVYQGLITTLEDTARTCQLWNLDMDSSLFEYTEQTLFFKSCFYQFQERMDELGAITPEQIVPYLLKHEPSVPSHLIWCCFDELTPQQRALHTYLKDRGNTVVFFDFDRPIAKTRCVQTTDEHDELNHMIDWLKQQYTEDKQRIGVVIPDLTAKSRIFTRLLNQHFKPNGYNLSLGQALSEIPLVSHALLWLQLNPNSLSSEEAALLLSSPFLRGAQTEIHSTSRFHQTHPMFQSRDINFSHLIQALKKNAPILGASLESISTYPEQASTTAWSAYFLNRLHQIGFPGDTTQDSATYQAYQRFLILFDEFDALNTLSCDMSQQEALAVFQDLAAHTLFKPQMPPARIQIMGLLEAAGCPFDALWISGLTDECLPQKTKFSPFIPLQLQKASELPYTNPARELKLARQTLQRFLCTTPQLILSFPSQSTDKPNRPSPLLTDWAIQTQMPACETTPWLPHRSTVPDAPMLPLHHLSTFRGTTGLLAYQAQCPFRAFARYRLNVQKAMTPCDGLSQQERGILVHHVMELIWQKLKNQTQLLTLNDEACMTLISECIDNAFMSSKIRADALPPVIQSLEKKRLQQLVTAMLVWEKQRPPFIVAEIEKKYTLTLGTISFHVRIDRKDILIEETEDGLQASMLLSPDFGNGTEVEASILPSPDFGRGVGEEGQSEKCIIIDYKNKLPDTTPWFDDKPTEPQILLYALLDHAIQTIMFAELAHPEPRFKGLSNIPVITEGIKIIDAKKLSWEQLKERWKTQLEALSQAFCAGEYAPAPSPTQCPRCEFQNLCRAPLVEA